MSHLISNGRWGLVVMIRYALRGPWREETCFMQWKGTGVLCFVKLGGKLFGCHLFTSYDMLITLWSNKLFCRCYFVSTCKYFGLFICVSTLLVVGGHCWWTQKKTKIAQHKQQQNKAKNIRKETKHEYNKPCDEKQCVRSVVIPSHDINSISTLPNLWIANLGPHLYESFGQWRLYKGGGNWVPKRYREYKGICGAAWTRREC